MSAPSPVPTSPPAEPRPSLAARRSLASLRVRLVIFGALLPTVILASSVVLVGVLFERLLLSGVDEAMRTQAAVEGASLFDAPDARPHVHLGRSPLSAEVRGVVSSIAVFDAHGRRVAQHPDDGVGCPAALLPADVQPRGPHSSHDAIGDEIREYVTVVRSPSGDPYAIWLGHDLAHHGATLRAYYQAGSAVVGLVALVLFALQLAHASRLHRRLERLAHHASRLRARDLDAELPPDDGDDEIAALNAALADATRELRAGRAARDRLVSDAAHELRTPLATMRAAIDVMLRRERSAEELRETLAHVREEVERLTSLSSALLDVASIGTRPVERTPFDLVDIGERAVAGARGAAEVREVTLTLDAPPALPLVGSAREVRQALDNLLANAVAYTAPSSEVRVTIERHAQRARVIVRDAGPGIPASEREHVFEPFHRGASRDPSRHPRGQGLGLAIVRDVARRHGGSAYVLDEPRPGAAIALELPSADESTRPAP